MTTPDPSPRWTPATLELATIAMARAAYAAEGEPWKQSDWDESDEDAREYGRRATVVVLDALADAGLLLPPGGVVVTPELTAVLEAARVMHSVLTLTVEPGIHAWESASAHLVAAVDALDATTGAGT